MTIEILGPIQGEKVCLQDDIKVEKKNYTKYLDQTDLATSLLSLETVKTRFLQARRCLECHVYLELYV